MDFSHLHIQDITEEVIAQALQTRESAFALFEHLAKIAEPDKDESQILRFLKRIAVRSAADDKLRQWTIGDLRVEIRPRMAFKCEIRLLRKLRGTFQLMRSVTAGASIRKLYELGMNLKSILPFVLIKAERNLLVFEAKAETRRNSLPPRAFARADKKAAAAVVIPKSPLVPRDLAPTLLAPEDIIGSEEKPKPAKRSMKPPAPKKDDVDDDGWGD